MNQNSKGKTHFQIERIAFFSDAVIAIAATLLIIEIHAPEIKVGSSFEEQLHQLLHLKNEFLGFVISFTVIITQWTKHHQLFGNVINYDKKLININAVYLFSNAIIPFSTSYFTINNKGDIALPIYVYGISLCFIILSNFYLFWYVTHQKNDFYMHQLTKEQKKWTTLDYVFFPIAIVLGLIISVFSIEAGVIVYLMISLLGFYVNKQKKKHFIDFLKKNYCTSTYVKKQKTNKINILSQLSRRICRCKP